MARARDPNSSSEAPHVLVSLLATRAAADRDEQLRDPASARAWLAGQDLLSSRAEVTEAEWQRLLELREGLHTLLLAPRRQWTPKTARLFNQAIRDAPLEVCVTAERTVRIASPDRSFDGALGTLVSLVIRGFFAGQWKRFKTCANDGCLKVFYDDSYRGTRR